MQDGGAPSDQEPRQPDALQDAIEAATALGIWLSSLEKILHHPGTADEKTVSRLLRHSREQHTRLAADLAALRDRDRAARRGGA